MTRAVMIAAPRSGSGKTTVTLGLLAALQAKQISVQAAKTGPDYIDPAFHEALTGKVSLNLDSWAMSLDVIETLLYEGTQETDLLIIEASMGLYDGLLEPKKRRGSPADIAAQLSIPVILVLDVTGQGQSAAAIAHGFATLDPEINVAGVILNRVASARHLEMTRQAIEAVGLPVLGALMRNASLVLPERHLGLVQAREHNTLPELFDTLAQIVEKSVDLEAVYQSAVDLNVSQKDAVCVPPPGQRIAVADDRAFSFLYGHIAQSWWKAGAEFFPFSPLADEGPERTADICWLPGGYPELYAGELAQAVHFKKMMQGFSKTKPVHGECGGFMVLGEALEDAQGKRHDMLGLLGHVTSFAKRKMNLGYREATLQKTGALGQKGDVFRGHEFHYARVIEAGKDDSFVSLTDGYGHDLGNAGGQRGHVSGSFFHIISHYRGD
ncbi:cobyrinate a,c-diamide synthase [Swingsia samuiensis]|uniref:Cobyrinate a,c-diamide synthase n=1 Tax=Swingsia samuiensis TaxID=1293412 RepID=A0A4Y6UM48_9PROT|nr:cobyrinate a,c-diamide synthase [Swingsia samuiensis]QDH17758.1 cobyrinate a,c-diamide synthase [Swingsia samuiensis]